MAVADRPALPITHAWVDAGVMPRFVGTLLGQPADATEVFVWDGETGDQVTDLYDQDGRAVQTLRVQDSICYGGVPLTVRIAQFSLGRDGIRLPGFSWDAIFKAIASNLPTDAAIANQITTEGSLTETALSSTFGAIKFAPLGDNATNQLAALQAGMNTAATFGLVYALNGQHVVNGELSLPTGLTLDGSRGSLRQTGAGKRTLYINNASRVTVRGVTVQGLMTDYTNTSAVYQSSAVYVDGTSSDVKILDCTLTSASGIAITGTPTNVVMRGNKIVGPGSSVITGITFNFSAGIAVIADTTGKWVAEGNEITGFAQGIVTGEGLTDVRVRGNYIHDIPGQHGLYLETMKRGVIADNIVRNCGVTGMKVQIATNAAGDATDISITGNVFSNVGAQAILLTNSLAGGTGRLRRVNVTGNVINTASGNGIEANNCVGLLIADNILNDVRHGVYVNNSQSVSVQGNRVTTASLDGISVLTVSDYTIQNNRVTNPGQTDTGTDEFGIKIDGATTAEGFIVGNVVTDVNAHMRYGIYFVAGDLTTHTVRENYVAGATDYGWRATTAANARSFRGNSFSGTIGSMLNPPTNFATNPDTSGATLAALETEVNELKAVLRASGLIAP